MTDAEFDALGRGGGVASRVVDGVRERFHVLGFCAGDETALACVAECGDARVMRLRFNAAVEGSYEWTVEECFDGPSLFAVDGAVFPE